MTGSDAASRVTYLTGLSRPVNMPQTSKKSLVLLPMHLRKGSQEARFRPSPRLAVRAAVSHATRFIISAAITAARGRKRNFSIVHPPLLEADRPILSSPGSRQLAGILRARKLLFGKGLRFKSA